MKGSLDEGLANHGPVGLPAVLWPAWTRLAQD